MNNKNGKPPMGCIEYLPHGTQVWFLGYETHSVECLVCGGSGGYEVNGFKVKCQCRQGKAAFSLRTVRGPCETSDVEIYVYPSSPPRIKYWIKVQNQNSALDSADIFVCEKDANLAAAEKNAEILKQKPTLHHRWATPIEEAETDATT